MEHNPTTTIYLSEPEDTSKNNNFNFNIFDSDTQQHQSQIFLKEKTSKMNSLIMIENIHFINNSNEKLFFKKKSSPTRIRTEAGLSLFF
jgi:hypothetical protein